MLNIKLIEEKKQKECAVQMFCSLTASPLGRSQAVSGFPLYVLLSLSRQYTTQAFVL